MKRLTRVMSVVVATTLLSTSFVYAQGNDSWKEQGKKAKSYHEKVREIEEKYELEMEQLQERLHKVVDKQKNDRNEEESELKKLKEAKKEELSQYKIQYNRKDGELVVRNLDGNLEIDTEDAVELEMELIFEVNEIKKSVNQSVYESVYDINDQDKAAGLRKIIAKLEAVSSPSAKDYTKLSLSYKALGDYEKALEYAQEALKADPESQKPLILMAQIYKLMNDPDKAMETLNKIMEEYPLAKVKAFMAIIQEEKGDLEAAKELLEEAIKEKTREIGLYKQLGKIYKKLGNDDIKVFVKGIQPEFDVKPTIVNDRTLVPLRAVGEALDANVEYDGAAHKVIITKGDTIIELPIGENIAWVNNVKYELDVPSVIIGDRTMVPLRFVSETLNTEVLWDGDTRTIIVNEK